ncbi:phenylacetic acid degradation protein PaaD [Gluconacetobacter sacchari DSM 12717]|uniref:Hydroxyphenylacetyl-CoA thioesterase PaaI n=2 Tax=Gluconacetobacter sacchari TaxID=92759 RepID=A0A7W4ICU9_9PROT|nr:hydroxyphenylacetyl-CoA thioesterase PaaI [Gluconacetobacter sacchari]MBB2160490.1 hydroxyphenylacetyl-CoA thioesterase PaaI [Gluconacetobacter sacchari]GBQ32809.1 phenylacetic acid degradation protein PaaD [Gluconacetobacter sacchari DSM 12717]
MTPEQRAQASAEALWTGDRASRSLGMEILEAGPGVSTVAMDVTIEMANGVGTAHGGFIFALADSAFAVACNSYNERTVAAHCAITYLRPGLPGKRMLARAREVSRAGRSGLYDVEISQEGLIIAQFRGHSRSIGGTLLPEPPSEP